MSDLKSKSISAFFWDLLGKIAIQGSGFIVSIFLARLLLPEEFGLIAMVMVIVGFANVLLEVGLGSALVQRKRLHEAHFTSAFYLNLFIGLLLTITIFFSAESIANFYKEPELIEISKALSFMFILSSLTIVQNAKLKKELNYALLTKMSIISSIISGIIAIILAFLEFGVWSLVCLSLLRMSIYNILIWSLKLWFPRLMFSWKALKQLWSFGFRLFISGVIDTLFLQLDIIIIGKIFNSLTLGYYQRAKSLNNLVIQYSSSSLMQVLFPVFSQIQHDLIRLKNIILRALWLLSLIVFFIQGLLYLTASDLIIILFSDKWVNSIQYFEIIILSGFSYPLSSLLVNILKGRGNSKAFLRLEIYKKSLKMINLIVGFSIGIEAYLYGLIITSVLAVSLNIFFAQKEINLAVNKFISPIISHFLIASIAVVIIKWIHYAQYITHHFISFTVTSLSFFIIYFGLVFLFRLKSIDELKLHLIPILKRIKR